MKTASLKSRVKISIIIPVINEADQIRLAIDRAWASGATEVVVVDGGSTDATMEIASGEKCLVVSSLPGRAIQMNCGANASQGDVLVFLHADNWLAAGSCDQIRTAFSDERNRFGGFCQKIEHSRSVYRWIESGNELRLKRQGLIYGDQAFFIRRALFESLGGFPEIQLMEDFAFSRKLRRHGKPVLLSGPTYISPRRWEKNGLARQTLSNWFLSFAYRFGASPAWLASRYRRHDN